MESERTEDEQRALDAYNKKRDHKNTRSRNRAIEKKTEIDRILKLPEQQRSNIEIQFLENALDCKARKNEGDRLRRRKLKTLGGTSIRRNAQYPALPSIGRSGNNDGMDGDPDVATMLPNTAHHEQHPGYPSLPPPYYGYGGPPSPRRYPPPYGGMMYPPSPHGSGGRNNYGGHPPPPAHLVDYHCGRGGNRIPAGDPSFQPPLPNLSSQKRDSPNLTMPQMNHDDNQEHDLGGDDDNKAGVADIEEEGGAASSTTGKNDDNTNGGDGNNTESAAPVENSTEESSMTDKMKTEEKETESLNTNEAAATIPSTPAAVKTPPATEKKDDDST